MKIIEVRLDKIQLDERAQPRCELNRDIIDEYAKAMRAGAKFPPIDVFEGPEGIFLADGYHRFLAGELEGLSVLPATVHEGKRRDAILFAVGANATHGVRRSRADKRRAVLTLLEDQEWQQWSDSEVAHQCGVSRPLVAELRAVSKAKKAHPAELQDTTRVVKRSGKVYSMDLTKIQTKRTKKQTPSTALEGESLQWVEFLLALPNNSLFQLAPAEIAALARKSGFTFEQARQLEGWFMRLAVFLDRHEQRAPAEVDLDELADLAFGD